MQLILSSRLISEGNGTNESRFPQSPLHSVAIEVREEEVVGSGPIKGLKGKPAAQRPQPQRIPLPPHHAEEPSITPLSLPLSLSPTHIHTYMYTPPHIHCHLYRRVHAAMPPRQRPDLASSLANPHTLHPVDVGERAPQRGLIE